MARQQGVVARRQSRDSSQINLLANLKIDRRRGRHSRIAALHERIARCVMPPEARQNRERLRAVESIHRTAASADELCPVNITPAGFIDVGCGGTAGGVSYRERSPVERDRLGGRGRQCVLIAIGPVGVAERRTVGDQDAVRGHRRDAARQQVDDLGARRITGIAERDLAERGQENATLIDGRRDDLHVATDGERRIGGLAIASERDVAVGAARLNDEDARTGSAGCVCDRWGGDRIDFRCSKTEITLGRQDAGAAGNAIAVAVRRRNETNIAAARKRHDGKARQRNVLGDGRGEGGIAADVTIARTAAQNAFNVDQVRVHGKLRGAGRRRRAHASQRNVARVLGRASQAAADVDIGRAELHAGAGGGAEIAGIDGQAARHRQRDVAVEDHRIDGAERRGAESALHDLIGPHEHFAQQAPRNRLADLKARRHHRVRLADDQLKNRLHEVGSASCVRDVCPDHLVDRQIAARGTRASGLRLHGCVEQQAQ